MGRSGNFSKHPITPNILRRFRLTCPFNAFAQPTCKDEVWSSIHSWETARPKAADMLQHDYLGFEIDPEMCAIEEALRVTVGGFYD